MSKHHVAAAAVALALFAAAATALAGNATAQKTYLLRATLDTRHETPPAKDAQGASGVFTATLTLSGKKGTFLWKLTFKNLSGPAIAAHVHIGAPGKAGPIAIPLCGRCTAAAHGSYTGPIGANPTLLKALLHGGAYANVHTKKNPNGEIRGQIKVTGTR